MTQPSARHCILHIGAPKTGSTALQSFLYANRAALQQAGWCYPEVCIRGFGHHDLAFLSAGGYPKWATPQPRPLEDLIELLRAAAAGNPRLILSSEDFYLMRNPEGAARALARAGIDPAATEIVVYLRRQDEAHLSWYNQAVKAQGYTGTVEQCVRECRELWDYALNLDAWTRAFPGARMNVRQYVCDDLSRWDVRRDFLDAVGIEAKGLVWRESPVNTRINRDLLELQRRVNRLPISPQSKRRFHHQLMALTVAAAPHAIFGDAPLLTAAQRAQLLQEYAESNARVAAAWFSGRALFGDTGGDAEPDRPVRGASLPKKVAYATRWLFSGRGDRRHVRQN